MTTPAHLFAQHVERHGHTVVLALLAEGLRLDEARELAHETWARLFEQWCGQQLDRLELPGLALRQAMYLLAERRRSARRPVDGPEALEGLVAHGASAERRAEARQALESVALALTHCSPRGRAVLTAVVAGPDLPHSQLASREGVSVQRFRQILCEVRAQLRRALGEGWT